MLRKSPALSLLAAILAYFALWLLVPKAGFLPTIVILALSTVAFMAIQVAIVYFFAKLGLNWWQSLLAFAVSVAGVVGLLQLVILRLGLPAKVGHYPGVKAQLVILGHYFGPERMPMAVLIMLAAASIGCLVALRVKDRNLLLPVVMFAAYIDFWTVTQGPVAAMLEHAPNIAPAVSAPIPHAGKGVFTPISMIGPGDFLFMALVFAAVSRLKMNGPRNYWFVCAAMTLGMAAVIFGLLDSLPALTVLAAGVVAANWREFKLSRQEAISTAIVAVLLLASLPLIWSALAPPPDKPSRHAPIQKR